MKDIWRSSRGTSNQQLRRLQGAGQKELQLDKNLSVKPEKHRFVLERGLIDRHPLLQVCEQVQQDIRDAVRAVEDHGSWDGRWSPPSRSTVEIYQKMMVLSPAESKAVMQSLERRDEMDRTLKPRFVLTDKNQTLRTETCPPPVKANARLIVPGFKDLENLRGELRKDSPTGSRVATPALLHCGEEQKC